MRSFRVVMMSAVRIAGVLLVFATSLFQRRPGSPGGARWCTRLAVGWSLSTAISLAGIVASAWLDIPTGATIVCTFGLALALVWVATALRRTASSGAAEHEVAGALPSR